MEHEKICGRFFHLDGSRILEGEGDKQRLSLHGVVVARRAEFRILTNEPNSKIEDPVILKLLSEKGVTHFPRLEVLYGFEKEFEFLKRFDFLIEFPYRGFSREQTNKSFMGKNIVTKTEAELNVLLKNLQGRVESNLAMELFKLMKAVHHNNPKMMLQKVIAFRGPEEVESYAFISETTLYAWLLMTQEIEVMKELCLARDSSLVIKSVQDYVANKMKKLHKHRVESDLVIPQTASTITITLPDFHDVLWPLTIDDYKLTNSLTYDVKQLGRANHISFIVRRNKLEILGYVTCSLGTTQSFRSGREDIEAPSAISDQNLYFYASDSFEPKVFSIFSIDGLHVTESVRGGRENSVAVLLVYHALYFIKHCVLDSKDMGDILIASNSYARSTMLILKQFGFSFTQPKRALKWLESDDKKTNLMDEVIYYIQNFKAQDPRLEELLIEAARDNSNLNASEIIKKLRAFYSKTRYNTDHKAAKEAFGKLGWNSFLALTTKTVMNYDRPRENLVFEREMTRITNLVQNTPTTRAEKRLFSDGESQGDEKRKKFSASFSEQFMDFL